MALGDVRHCLDAAWPGLDQLPWSTAPASGPVGRLGCPSVSDPWDVGSFVSLGLATCVRCPGTLGSCSPVHPFGALCCVCGVPGHLGPFHRCARLVCHVTSAVLLGHLAPLHRCARSVCYVVCWVSWATWLLFTGVSARCAALCVQCPRPFSSCSPCARPWCSVDLLPSVHVRVRCPGPCGACSPVCALFAVRVCRWRLCPSSSPPSFFFPCLLVLFLEKKK